MREVWKYIKGYAGLYKISNFGKIWSKGREGTKGGILLLTRSKKGYLYVGLRKEGHQKRYRVSRLVAETFIPNFNNKLEVNHKDGIKINNELTNLEWRTHQENIDHAKKLGLILKGEKSKKTNLINKDVLLIREYLKDEQYSIKQISKVFNVSQRTVSHISLGQSWKHLLEEGESLGEHRTAKGIRNAASKLTEDDVREIKRLLVIGNLTQRKIGNMFGVDHAIIGRIKKGKAWKHVM